MKKLSARHPVRYAPAVPARCKRPLRSKLITAIFQGGLAIPSCFLPEAEIFDAGVTAGTAQTLGGNAGLHAGGRSGGASGRSGGGGASGSGVPGGASGFAGALAGEGPGGAPPLGAGGSPNDDEGAAGSGGEPGSPSAGSGGSAAGGAPTPGGGGTVSRGGAAGAGARAGSNGNAGAGGTLPQGTIQCGTGSCRVNTTTECCFREFDGTATCAPSEPGTSCVLESMTNGGVPGSYWQTSLRCNASSDCATGEICCHDLFYIVSQTTCMPAEECADFTEGRYSHARTPTCTPGNDSDCPGGTCVVDSAPLPPYVGLCLSSDAQSSKSAFDR